jgi:hypothetical protein
MGLQNGISKQMTPTSSTHRRLRSALLLPGLLLLCSSTAMVGYCRHLLQQAAAGVAIELGGGFWLAVGSFVASCAAVALLQTLRIAHRVAGPEHRLRRALQRMRGGDLGFRIALRRGDLLGGLARECNELLDWLNHNPPAGVRTGGDVVDIGQRAAERRP